MLHLYTNKNRIPESKIYTTDCTLLLDIVGVKTEFAKKIISFVDKGTYLDSSSFIDRFGYKTRTRFLSSTSKMLIGLELETDYCLDISEIGHNIMDYLLQTNGYAYTNVNYIEFYGSYVELDFNGTVMPAGTASYLMSIHAETIEESYAD